MRLKFHINIHSIKYKYIFATLIIFLISFAVIIFVWYINLTYEAKNETTDNIYSIMQVSNNSFESYLKDIDGITALLTTRSSNYLTASILEILSPNKSMSPAQLVQCREEANDFLVSLCSFKKYLNGLTVSDLYGNTMTYGITATSEQMKSQPWYGKIINRTNPGPIFIAPHYLYKNDIDSVDKVFSIARPVFNGNRETGYVIADIKCEIFDKTYNVRGLDGMSIVIADGKSKQFVYKSQSTPRDLTERSLTALINRFGGDSGSFYFSIGGTNELVVYCKSSFTNWTTIGIIPEKVVMQSFIKAREKVIFISVLLILSASVVIYALTLILTKNLLRLSNAITSVGKDNLDIKVKINSKDEIAQIYHQFNLMTDRINQLVQDNKKAEQKKMAAEIRALQTQITPHFLYNTLNTIRFLSVLQGADNIKTVAENLSTMLHISMDGRRFISIREELDSIKSYIDIQKYRYTNKFLSDIRADSDTLDYMIPKLIIQPIVENALLHGIAPIQREGIVTIKIIRDGDDILILVKDNGVGISCEKAAKLLNDGFSQNHIGLSNVNYRIKMYFGEKYGITINSEENLYTSVDILIPAITESEAMLID